MTTGYDGYGRLLTYARTGEPSQTNGYNGLDDRVSVASGSTTHEFVYDPDGRLISEYDASGSSVAETVWLSPSVGNDNQPLGGDDGVGGGYAPLAVATGTGSSAALYWVHGNHLGVPLVATNSSGAVATPPIYTMPGYPGQTRTLGDIYYNQYRDYDSSTGRYIQADPIGLEGGNNLYLYAKANPLRWTDPTGQNPLVIAVGFCAINPEVCAGVAASAGIAIYSWYKNGPDCPDILLMPRPGRQVDTGIEHRVNEIRSAALMAGGKRPDRCEILDQLIASGEISAEDAKPTRKAWAANILASQRIEFGGEGRDAEYESLRNFRRF